MDGMAPCYIPEGEEHLWPGNQANAPCFIPDPPDVKELIHAANVKAAATRKANKKSERIKATLAAKKAAKAAAAAVAEPVLE
ncbi:MAG: hypothetical protein H0X07_00180 [Gemmatimonadales bacterium]|nr:hypothetical protein [Gemmatimonadales bacterium]